MVYDINGNPISTDGVVDGVFSVFNSDNVLECQNPDGIFANATAVISAYDNIFDGLNVEKNLIGYGTSPSGGQDTNLPIYEYVIHNPIEADQIYPPPKILLTAGVHGDERTAVAGLFNLMKMIVTRTDDVSSMLRNSVQYRIVPLVNPGGYNNNRRVNPHNVDINRNFGYNWSTFEANNKGSAPYSEYETKALKSWANAQAEGSLFMLDLHNHLASQSTTYFYICTNNVKLKSSFSVVCRGLYSHYKAQNIDLANYSFFQQGVTGPVLSAEFSEILGVEAATVEAPTDGNVTTYIRPTTDLDGNLIHELLKNYLWLPE